MNGRLDAVEREEMLKKARGRSDIEASDGEAIVDIWTSVSQYNICVGEALYCKRN